MLRIHFTEQDLARTRIATAPDPLWETVLGAQKLIRQESPVFAAWRRRARAIGTELPVGALRMLTTLAPPVSYFPDFLTPVEAADGLTAGLDALLGTSRERLRRDISYAATKRPLPPWAHRIGAGDRALLHELAEAMQLVHDSIIAPAWTEVEAHVDADRTLRGRALRDGGVDHMLDSLRPVLCWDPPILSGRYPVAMNIHLNGRGLRLIPSYFNWGNPVALADPDLPPIVVYPVPHTTSWLWEATDVRRPAALAALLGPTRAKVLAALRNGATTGELADRLRISTSSASEHVSVLRAAGLASSQPMGAHTLHALSSLGIAVLTGQLDW